MKGECALSTAWLPARDTRHTYLLTATAGTKAELASWLRLQAIQLTDCDCRSVVGEESPQVVQPSRSAWVLYTAQTAQVGIPMSDTMRMLRYTSRSERYFGAVIDARFAGVE